MPTYEYRCTQCDSVLEVVQSIHEDALSECPTCGGKLRKLFGNVGIVFKGSGFYRTDNRGKSRSAGASANKPAAKESKPAAPATSGENSGKTATTPASSAPGKPA